MIEKNVNFCEAKYMLNYDIKEKPKCLICEKSTKFSKEAYGYLQHCEEHLYDATTSRGEKEISDFLNTLNVKFETNNRNEIYKELDIFVKDKGLAIEYNGVYWHSELFVSKNYHHEKWNRCNNKKIKLFTIWEDEWRDKNELMKSMIKNQLGLNDNLIYARNTNIRLIENGEKRDFLNENHLQGTSMSSINLGLFYNDQLVSLMTFGKARMVLNSLSNEGEYELLRFCNKQNTSVIGGASKLFKYFIDNFKPNKIISYANCDISNGDLYEKLGFENKGHIGLNYWWAKNGIKYHRSNFMKQKLVKEGYNPEKTEDDIMRERGYVKIWGSGNLKFEKVF
jgi:hypothetical protein